MFCVLVYLKQEKQNRRTRLTQNHLCRITHSLTKIKVDIIFRPFIYFSRGKRAVGSGSMFTLLYLFICLLQNLNSRLEYRHKIVILQILFLLTLSLHHLQNKKRSDAVIRYYHNVLQTRQEVTAANEPPPEIS